MGIEHTPLTNNVNFQSVFTHLKNILVPYVDELTLETNEASKIYINTKFVMPNNKVMFFGAATIGKNYVSFNFKSIDTKLFGELSKLTEAGYEKYIQKGYI